MADPIPAPPKQDADIYARLVWTPQIRDTMRELPAQRFTAAGQLIYGTANRSFGILAPPTARSALGFSAGVPAWLNGNSFAVALGTIEKVQLEASLQLPDTKDAANRWLRATATGYELTEEAPWQ